MFTVKICNPGSTLFFETHSVGHEVLDGNHELLRFESNGEKKQVLLSGFGMGDSSMPDHTHAAERVYVMNETGKTVDSFHYTAKSGALACGMAG